MTLSKLDSEETIYRHTLCSNFYPELLQLLRRIACALPSGPCEPTFPE